jgi:hypothetical protein
MRYQSLTNGNIRPQLAWNLSISSRLTFAGLMSLKREDLRFAGPFDPNKYRKNVILRWHGSGPFELQITADRARLLLARLTVRGGYQWREMTYPLGSK